MSVAPDPIEPDRSGSPAGPDLGTFVDALIAEQRQLTAVERFSRRHEAHTGPAMAPHYRDLIPLTAPRPGEQYGFEVDLDRCSGCKGCVTACHSLNGLDEGESWRSVGFLVGEKIVPAGRSRGDENHSSSPTAAGAAKERRDRSLLTSSATAGGRGNRVIPLQQTVTTACHHCVEPACMHGCPVLAYDKDPITGIVRHLDDQCIGCSYCILKCPYEVPRYSASRGIVRKCDLCHGRLADGEAPACVQACPNEAIQIRLVRTDDLRRRFGNPADLAATGESSWLPDAPSPSLSLPTTSYRTCHPEASLRAADHALPQPAHLHGPLVLMLVLTQAGLGGLLAAAWCVSDAQRPFLQSSLGGALLSLGLLLAGLAASALHLGQPRKAWRVFLGWRRSWL
ncbi:MAG: 4Fe-4S dicluster domain-containing protein, partial [Verrucomicrobia bacterium]|nr:4Fe-4S dicluster domain-containing protein [Verrucomicrobiota bacterium]